MIEVHYIERDGQRLAVIPAETWDCIAEYSERLLAKCAPDAAACKASESTLLKVAAAAGHSRIRTWRKSRGLLIRELAQKANISKSYLQLIENGDRPATAAVVQRLADALGLPPSALVDLARPASPGMPTTEYSQHNGVRFALIPEDTWDATQSLLAGAFDPLDATLATRAAHFPLRVRLALATGDTMLRAWRVYRQVTERRLAQIAGISASYLRMMELGERAGSVQAWNRISAALEVEKDLLMAYPQASRKPLATAPASPTQASPHKSSRRAVKQRANREGISMVKAWRLELGLTQSSAAARMGITPNAFGELERRSNHRVSTLHRAAHAFGISIQDLLP